MPSETFARRVGYVGAAANWLIPIAAIKNLFSQPVENVNVPMATILTFYSALFCRWAIAISPPNWPLLVCHFTNSSVQAMTLGKKALGVGPKSKET